MIPVNQPLLSGNEKKYLIECIDSGWISSEGPFVKKFEEQFSNRVERKYAIAVCNGTSALELAIRALDIGQGDEVILPSFTIISCVLAVIRSGAKPVLVDVYPDTWNMSVEQVRKKITKHTRAIMVVHTYGLPAAIDEIIDLANEKGLHVIEDAAHVHGHAYNNKPCGSFGTISIFSFYPNKIITSGEGGMVLTNDQGVAEKCRYYANLCFGKDDRFVHENMGWNFRMSNLQAAVGLAQLEQIDNFTVKKKLIGNLYHEAFSDLHNIQLPAKEYNGCENIYWVFGLVLDDQINLDAKEVIALMRKKGIECRPFFWPMHKQPVLIKTGLFRDEQYPVSERLAKKGLYLPSGLGLTKEEQGKVIDIIRKEFGG